MKVTKNIDKIFSKKLKFASFKELNRIRREAYVGRYYRRGKYAIHSIVDTGGVNSNLLDTITVSFNNDGTVSEIHDTYSLDIFEIMNYCEEITGKEFNKLVRENLPKY